MTMRALLVALPLLAGMVTPALAQTSIRGQELTPADAARVARQCDVLRFRMPDSGGTKSPEEPLPGESAGDPSSYWAAHADGIDAALAKINLDTLTIRECREAGFYD